MLTEDLKWLQGILIHLRLFPFTATTARLESVVFGDKRDIATDNYPYSIAISDFDGDGRADHQRYKLLCRNYLTNGKYGYKWFNCIQYSKTI